MNIYKLENKECELYKTLKARIDLEVESNKFNKELIENHVPYEFERYSAYKEHNAALVITYCGFFFLNPEEVDRKVWKEDKDGCFFPNRRTKAGKEMAKIMDSQRRHGFYQLMDVLDISNVCGRFKIPQLFYHVDAILVVTDDNHRLTDSNLVEITRGELDTWLDKINEYKVKNEQPCG